MLYSTAIIGDSIFHRIQFPDSAGIACNFQKRILHPNRIIESMPYFPYYRLGALEGSPADTLGLPGTYAVLGARDSVLQPIRCQGDSTAMVQVKGMGGIPPYAYLWSTGDTTAVASGLGVGTYTCTVTDSFANVYTHTVVVTAAAALSSSAASTPNTSATGNGTATVVPTGGVPPYQVQWANGAVANPLTGLYAGEYRCTITDANGCVTRDTVVVGGIARSTEVPISTTPLLCDGYTNGGLALTAQPGHHYQWSTGDTTAAIGNLGAGTYWCIITDPAGAGVVVFATLTAPAPLTATVNNTPNASATGNGTATANPAGGTPPYTYWWSTGATVNPLTGLFPGSYTCFVTDANGCETAIATEVAGWAVNLLPEALEGSGAIRISPNPTTGAIMVELTQGEALLALLTDALGREVLRMQPGSGRFALSLEGLPTGLYGLRVQTRTGAQWVTVVKE
jgi:hypothetical protein